MSYVLVTPARNEEDNIARTVESVLAQTALPLKWVIVSDGSSDCTEEIVEKFCATVPWLSLLRLPMRPDRNFAAKVQAFNRGFSAVAKLSFDAVGSLDADVSFDSTYFEFLLDRLGEDPSLGVVGTPFLEDGSHYDFRFASIEHVSGACQLFRRECFESIGGYTPIAAGAVDWVAVTTARMRGWRTRTFLEKVCHHHRKMGTGNASRLGAWFRQGRKDFMVGGHPVWEVMRTLYQMKRRPYFVGGLLLLTGYVWAAMSRIQRPLSKELMAFHRREQLSRLKARILNKSSG